MTDYIDGNVPVSQPDKFGCYRWMAVRAGLPSKFCSPGAPEPAIRMFGDIETNGQAVINPAPPVGQNPAPIIRTQTTTPLIFADIVGSSTPEAASAKMYANVGYGIVENILTFTIHAFLDDITTAGANQYQFSIDPSFGALFTAFSEASTGLNFALQSLSPGVPSPSTITGGWSPSLLTITATWLAPITPNNRFRLIITGNHKST